MQDVDILIVAETGGHERYIECIHRHPRLRLAGVVDSARAARTRLAHCPPALLLLDVRHPQRDGLELMRAIVAAGSATGTVFASACHDRALCARALACGAFDYLLLPLDTRRLCDTLGRFIVFHDAMAATASPTQAAIDTLLALRAARAPGAQPSGFSQATLRRVQALFLTVPGEHSAHSVAHRTGLCATTARRCLEHCVESRFLHARLVHGHVGRPQRVFRHAG